ncbi:ABC transporter substrate-binding protein [Halorussus salinisoli]|uniref:ABC transporter substrate-binding protein n=1 Tax=Halorussus salinisoli TaxID=2558242 RepID=UPI0010C18EBA|nr:ABC transporter substrate-binding protein [Halorussus salinisoli]
MARRTTRRRFLQLTGVGTGAALAGCAGNAPDEPTTTESTTTEPAEDSTETSTGDDTETSPTGGTLRLASAGPIQTLDPTNAKGSGAGYNQYAESLFHFPNGDLPPKPKLAKGHSISNDGKTYTFDLREDVTFHDGQEFTAQDVVYSWRRLAESSNSRNADDIVGSTFTIAHETETYTEDGEEKERIVPDSLAVEAVDDYTFRFTLEQAFHGALSQIAGGAFAIIPENSVGDIEGYDGEYEYNEFFSTSGDGPTFAATGPFEVDAWSKGNELALSAYEDYYGEGPNIDGITFTVLNSADTRYKRFLNENLDIVNGIPTSKFDPNRRSIESDEGDYRVGTYELENGRTVNYGEATVLDSSYVLFNCQRTPRPVRRAFAYLINQEAIARDIYKELARPAYHMTPPPVFMHRDGEEPTENYDKHAQNGFRSQIEYGANGWPYGMGEARIDEAKQVMEESDLDTPYEVEFTVFSGDSEWDQISKRLRDKAQAAGINVNIQKADFGTIISKAINGDMDMFSLTDGMEWPESDNFLRFLHPYPPDSVGSMFTRWTFEDKSKYTEFMEIADEAWNDLYVPNKGPGQQAQRKRNEAYYILEETNWAAIQQLPTVHATSQRFWDPSVDVRMFGTMENQSFNTATLGN